MGGAHRPYKAPGPAGSTARIKAGSASSLFQAKRYKLLYSNPTVKLKSREKKTKQNQQKTKIKPNKNSPHKTREHWKKTCLEQSISAAIAEPGLFFHFISLNFFVWPTATQPRSVIHIQSKLQHCSYPNYSTPLLRDFKNNIHSYNKKFFRGNNTAV